MKAATRIFGLTIVLTQMVLMVLVCPAVASADQAVEVTPAHGLPGSTITVTPKVQSQPSDCVVVWDTDPQQKTFACGWDAKKKRFLSTALTVPKTASTGTHKINVYLWDADGTVVISGSFNVDPPVTTSTTPTTDTHDPPTPTVRPATPTPPTLPISTTPPTTTTTPTPSSPTTTDTTTHEQSHGGGTPLGVVMIIALASAVTLPIAIRGLRQRSPKWVAEHVSFHTTAGLLRINEGGSRSGAATSVRIEVHVDSPRRR
jgi:hypothetical protein